LDVEIRILDGILKLLNAITSRDASQSVSNDTIASDASMVAYLSQLLNTCKCLFVSHRKIAIYLNDLHKRPLTRADGSRVEDNRVCLSNIRVPLSWKYNDYLKATKNSGNFLTEWTRYWS
jgi:hypothetical protein